MPSKKWAVSLFSGSVGSGQGFKLIDKILNSVERRSVLTVSDIDRAAERGAVIQFTNERNRLRLRINVAAAKAAGLTISSKLLRPAEIVGERQG